MFISSKFSKVGKIDHNIVVTVALPVVHIVVPMTLLLVPATISVRTTSTSSS